MRVYIGTSREIGKKCIEWAKEHTPAGFELVDTMNNCDIFISVLYDKILPIEYLKGLKGAYNFHPQILPEYRGAGGYSWAIINGESEAGVTLHKIDDGIDTGDIIGIGTFLISSKDTAEQVFKRAEAVILDMFQDYYVRLLKEDFVTQKQDESKARTYYRKDLDKAKDLTRFIRALTFKGKESAYYYNKHGEKIYIEYDTPRQ